MSVLEALPEEKMHTPLAKLRYSANFVIREAASIDTTTVGNMIFACFLTVMGEVDSDLDKV